MSRRPRQFLTDLPVSGIDQARASTQSTATSPTSSALGTMIRNTGNAQRAELQRLREALEQYQQRERQGGVVMDLPVEAVRRNPLAMRSEHYFGTAAYRSIRESIQRHGQREPIKVRPLPGEAGLYQVIKGDTRLRIHQELGRITIKALVEDLDDIQAALETLIENRDRQDPSAMDTACYHARVLEQVFAGDRALTIEALGCTPSWLSRQVTISTIPEPLVAAFPQLHESPTQALYDLGMCLRNHSGQVPTLIDRGEQLVTIIPAHQARRLVRALLHGVSEPVKTPLVSRSGRVEDAQGRLLVSVRRRARGGLVLDFPKTREGFADFVHEQLTDLLDRYERSLKADPD